MTISCQKELDPFTPETIDSVKSILLKQMIVDSGQPDSAIFSFKYDTLNYTVEVYEDDPSTPGIFDKLVITSTFNKDGYLLSFNINTDQFYNASYMNAVITINRTSDNKINYVANYDRENEEKDTIFYTYESVSEGIKISTERTMAYFGYNYYTYDKNNKLLSYQFADAYGAVAQFHYNANNSLKKIVKTGGSYENVAEFSYTSGLPDAKEDMLFSLLLGKDHYLWDLMELSPFSIYLDSDYDDGYPVSFTNPYHLTRMQDTHRPSDYLPTGIEGFNITYELNENKLLSKLTITYDEDDEDNRIVLFKY